MEAAFECGVCLEIYQETGLQVPRLLGCGHSICTDCIGSLVVIDTKIYVVCPFCQSNTDAKLDADATGDDRDAYSLPKNFALLDIIRALPSKQAATDAKQKKTGEDGVIKTEDRLLILEQAYRHVEVGMQREIAKTKAAALVSLDSDDEVKTWTGKTLKKGSSRLRNLNKIMRSELTQAKPTLQKYTAEQPGDELRFKVVIAGASDVGKTSLNYYFANGESCIENNPTHGANCKKLKRNLIDDQQLTIEMWDTAGPEKQMPTLTPFCRGADALLLVFDVSQPQTLLDLEKRLPYLLQSTREDNPAIFILGNKVDAGFDDEDDTEFKIDLKNVEKVLTNIKDKLVLRQKQLQQDAKHAPCTPPFVSYFYVSAKTGYNCQNVMEQVRLQIAYQKIFGNGNNSRSRQNSKNGRKVSLGSGNNRRDSCCK